MKSICSLLLSLTLAAQALPPEVTNVRASQRIGTKLIDITYDLTSPDGGDSTIQLEISLDGGQTWRAPVNTVTGQIGEGVAPGNNRVATWNAGLDFDGNLADNCRARVSAFDGDDPTPPVGMVYIPPGTFQMGDDKGGNSPLMVTLTKGFFINRTEESYADFVEVFDWNNSQVRSLQFSLGAGGTVPGYPIQIFLGSQHATTPMLKASGRDWSQCIMPTKISRL